MDRGRRLLQRQVRRSSERPPSLSNEEDRNHLRPPSYSCCPPMHNINTLSRTPTIQTS